MAHFYGSMTNSRHNEVTASEPGYAHLRGWGAGVQTVPYRNRETGRDEFRVYMTSGSNGRAADVLIGTVYDTPEGPRFEPAALAPELVKAAAEPAEV